VESHGACHLVGGELALYDRKAVVLRQAEEKAEHVEKAGDKGNRESHHNGDVGAVEPLLDGPEIKGHDDEQEQDDHRARVDDDLERREQVGVQHQKQERQREHRDDQKERARHGLRLEDDAQGREDGDEGDDPE
jgi:hypothetical protein